MYHGTKDRCVPSSESENAFAVVVGKKIPNDVKYPATLGKYKIARRENV